MGGIITKQKLGRLRREIADLRVAKHNIRPSDLVALAKRLGRKPVKRGKHPTYESELLLSSNPLSIPGHPTIKPTTAMSILDELEGDIDRLSELLDEQGGGSNANRDQLSSAAVRKSSDT